MTDYRRYLDPKALAKVSSLELRARFIVEGFFSGMHHSPRRGASVEFADHRAYTQGDDLRHIDWKVYGKTDKYYIKEYEQETNIDVMVVVDASESMTYRYAAEGMSKYDYATSAAAAVAYLALQQHDSVGLAVFDETVTRFVRPSNSVHQWMTLLRELSEARSGGAAASIGRGLEQLGDRLTHRMLVVLISDWFDDPALVLQGLRHLRYRKHDLIVWCVWDRAERSFPFERPTMFEGLEAGGRVLADPRSLKARYLEEAERFRARLRTDCARMQADMAFFDTSTPLDAALSGYLATRSGRLRQRSARTVGGG